MSQLARHVLDDGVASARDLVEVRDAELTERWRYSTCAPASSIARMRE